MSDTFDIGNGSRIVVDFNHEDIGMFWHKDKVVFIHFDDNIPIFESIILIVFEDGQISSARFFT
jgi:hypothetical protein